MARIAAVHFCYWRAEKWTDIELLLRSRNVLNPTSTLCSSTGPDSLGNQPTTYGR
jgi:hypothetical protein